MLVREKEMRCRRGWRVGRKRVGAKAVLADVESKELRMEFPAQVAIELERDVASLKAVTCGHDAKSFFSSSPFAYVIILGGGRVTEAAAYFLAHGALNNPIMLRRTKSIWRSA